MNPSFFKNLGPINVTTIKKHIDCDVHGLSDETNFVDFSSIQTLKKNTLSFLVDGEFSTKTKYNEGTIICSDSTRKKFNGDNALILVKDVQLSVAILSHVFYRSFHSDEIDELHKPIIGSNCKIANTAIIENGAVIGKNVNIAHGCVVGFNSIIGDNTSIDCNSIITNSIIAEKVKIGRNCSIGQQGFGFAMINGNNINIFHKGRVILQTGVNIGSMCTVDRGSFKDTVIGENTFFDNLCHIAHNVTVGNNCAFAAMSGIAGSATVGNNVMAGGQSGIAGHLNIGNNVKIAAQSGVLTDLNDNKSVMGHPAINKFQYIKNYKKIYD
tara:strand:- start:3571 stop:4548 length:978 start_codon:yes stop_codon:yes gene_type:complete